MMKIVAYERALHENELTRWFCLRGLDAKTAWEVPVLGFVAFDDEILVAMAFARRCEGHVAIFEGLSTNPDLGSKLRHRGINMVVKKILKRARADGVKVMLTYSVDVGTIERALALGFEELPHRLLALNLLEDRSAYGFHWVSV